MRIPVKTVVMNVVQFMGNVHSTSAVLYTMNVATQLITVTCRLAARGNGVFVTDKELCLIENNTAFVQNIFFSLS